MRPGLHKSIVCAPSALTEPCSKCVCQPTAVKSKLKYKQYSLASTNKCFPQLTSSTVIVCLVYIKDGVHLQTKMRRNIRIQCWNLKVFPFLKLLVYSVKRSSCVMLWGLCVFIESTTKPTGVNVFLCGTFGVISQKHNFSKITFSCLVINSFLFFWGLFFVTCPSLLPLSNERVSHS